MKKAVLYLLIISSAFVFSACKKQKENYFRKREEKKDTKVEGKVTFEDGTAAASVYVNIIQYIKKPKYNDRYVTNVYGKMFLVQQIQTDGSGNYTVTFKAEEKTEGYEGDYDDYYILITKTQVEEIYWIDYPLPNSTVNVDVKDHGKIKMRHKNKINIVIK